MNASVVGSGYIGTTVAACLADISHDVIAVDIDQAVDSRPVEPPDKRFPERHWWPVGRWVQTMPTYYPGQNGSS
jgi:nucleoside-diphosphate-sugar epimerase